MEKRSISLILLLLTSTMIWAGHVPEQVARQKAAQWMKRIRPQSEARLQLEAPASAMHALPTGDAPYYIYNDAEGRGFVIISGDDRTEAVLGYGDEGSFSEAAMPENMRQWLSGIVQEMAQLDMYGIDGTATATVEQALPEGVTPNRAPGRSRILPLLTSKWNQGSPYNTNMQPDPVTKEAVQTGCVATAMGQVMYYYQYPSKTEITIPAYTTDTYGVTMTAIAPTDIKWDLMLPVYDDNASTAQREEVGKLMLLCGQSVRMDYRSTGSSSSISRSQEAFVTYFGYDAGIQLITRSFYHAEEWDDIIYNELKNRRPVIYRGVRDRGGSDSSHAFVVDGYDGSGLYHLNWGWGGSYNGYFLLSVLSPYETSASGLLYDNEGYAIDQQALIGIQPDAGGEPAPPLLTAYNISIGGATTFYRSSATQDFTDIGLVSQFYNVTGSAHVFDQGIGAWDKDGNLVACMATASNLQFGNNLGYNAFESNYSFGSGLPNGKYRIINICREHGNTAWQADINSEHSYILAEIKGNTLTLAMPTVQLAGDITTEGITEAGSLVKLHVDIYNGGSDFSDYVYLFVDGIRKGGRYVEVAAGETTEVEMGFVPSASGSRHLMLVIVKNKEYHSFCQTTVNVDPASVSDIALSLVSTNADGALNVGSQLRLTVNAKNNGSERYDNRLRGYIYKLKEGTNTGTLAQSCDIDVNIASGKSANAEFTFSSLDVGAHYFLFIYPVSNGTVDSNRRLYSGIYTIVSTATGIAAIPVSGDGRVDIYSIDGRRVGTYTEKQLPELLQQLPKAVYIVNGVKLSN